MIIKLAKILDVEEPLSEIMKAQLPLKLAYILGKLVKTIGIELREFHILREKLIKSLGVPGDNDTYKIEDEANKEVFTNELNDLASIDVDLVGFEPISISELDGVDIKMSPMHMSALSEFFKD